MELNLVALASAALLGVMLVIALWNLVTAPRLESLERPARRPGVSLLIPARDEVENLRSLGPALLAIDYPDLEIILLDDSSADGTLEMARALQSAPRNAGVEVRVISGASLPAGWLGKNWACHQLSLAATRDIFLFVDADVTPAPGSVAATVAAMGQYPADVVTVLPHQETPGWVESAVVPLVTQLIPAGSLPLSLAARFRSPSLSIANGQWLAFTRPAYLACGGHCAVRGEVLEDVQIGRRVKRSGHRLLPVISTTLVRVRMYRGWPTLRSGFAKNLYPLAGGSPAPFLGLLVVFALTMFYPWVAAIAGGSDWILPLAMLVGLRVVVIALFRQGVRSLFLHPVGVVLLVGIALKSWWETRRGGVIWKGREVSKEVLPGRSNSETWRLDRGAAGIDR